jgi:alkylhydroperoxidase family enzyme
VPEVLDIRELGGDEPGPESATAADAAPDVAGALDGGAPSRWRRRAAAGVVAVLFVSVGYLLTAGRPRTAGTRGTGEAATAAAPVEQAQRALDAWARFASTGDLNQLGDTFDRSGPQFARLSAEATAMRAATLNGAPYAFSATVVGVSAGDGHDEQVVAAELVLSRPGETDQNFAWDLVLRRSGGQWRLWTVRERAAASTTTRGTP